MNRKERKSNRDKMKLDGTLTKNCKKHGLISAEKIRVDVRGTSICKICDCENTKKYRDRDPEAYKERVKKWLYSDRERVRRYREQDKENRRKRQVRSYHRTRQNDPIKHKEKQKRQRMYSKKARDRLDDYYVKNLLKDVRKQHNKTRNREILKEAIIPQEIIEIKRLQLKIERALGKRVKNGD